MSASLSNVHNQVRKRVGFQASTNELSNERDQILDEQEQDEVIDDIRHQMVKSDHEHQVGFGIIVLLSCVLHVIYLFNPHRPPTAVLFSIHNQTSPIPLSTMFTYFHISLQGYLCTSVFHLPINNKIHTFCYSVWSNMRTSTGLTPPIDPHLFPLLASSIAPILCIILRKDWANFTWWCFCVTLFSTHVLVQRRRLRDEARVESLEKLKYRAKGA